ncbi:MAG: beta-lactamase family protein [Candidatus Eremiobacteraeota bacterium]|nr:beta-lactamase family protein [Candidatus Eremiobacteraeota bacterium]
MTHLFLAAALALSAAQRAQIDTIVGRVMQQHHVAGLSLGIARRGRRLYLRGYGLRDVRDRMFADGYTVYRVGSIAKQFAAAVVLQEAAAGRIALTNAVHRYLSAGTGDVTIAQLLNQTSGIATQSTADSPQFVFDPGGGWLYSNANYALLGAVLETVTGETYPSLLRARITAPAGLASTACAASPFAQNRASGYAWRDRDWSAVPDEAALDGHACSTIGLYSNAADVLRWLEDVRTARIVPKPFLAAMFSSGRLPDGVLTHYGYGFFLTDWYGYDVAEHPGFVEGFSSEDALVRQDGLEIAVMTNARAVDLTPLLESIVAILDAPRDAALAATFGAAPENENLRVTAAVRELLQTSGFASYGVLRALEFVSRTLTGGLRSDRYRATFSIGQWWAVVDYRANSAIESISLTPIQ